MKPPDTALLDADIIAYKAACWADSNNASVKNLLERLIFDVKYWTPPGIHKSILAFSCSRASNFRKDHWPSYKDNRKGKPSPSFLPVCKDILMSKYSHVERDRLEADDLLGIGMSSETVIGVSLDKDLMSCPGWFWNPDKMDFPCYISKQSADYWFHKQWLMGDSTDNIPGIPKVGKVKASKILDAASPTNWGPVVMKNYEEKGFDLDYCLSQARCVRILRDGEWDKQTGIPQAWAPEWTLTPESKRD